jgi:hypothetical protein
MRKPKPIRDLRHLARVTLREAGLVVGWSADRMSRAERTLGPLPVVIEAKLVAYFEREIGKREAAERGRRPDPEPAA